MKLFTPFLPVLLLVSCQQPAAETLQFTQIITRTAPLSATTVLIDPKRVDIGSGIQVQAGRWYLFTTQTTLDAAGHIYADSSPSLLPANADGPTSGFGGVFNALLHDSSSQKRPQNRLRVRRDASGKRARFMQLIGCIGPSTSHPQLEKEAFIIGSKRVWQAPRSGELHLFVNDWPEDSSISRPPQATPYTNNKGGLILTVTPLPSGRDSPLHLR